MKRKYSIYFLPLYIAIGLITKIFVLSSYMPIPMINTESNIEKFVILLEDSIKNQVTPIDIMPYPITLENG
jgi:hypothetical protein